MVRCMRLKARVRLGRLVLLRGAATLTLGALAGQEHGVDVWEHTAGGDGDGAEELGELFVVADRELDVAGHDAGLLVVAGRVAGELEDLGGEVLEDGGEVHGGTGTDAGGVLANLEVARDAADGELEARLGGAAHSLLSGLSFTSA